MGMCLAYCLILNFLNQILYIIFVKLEREEGSKAIIFSCSGRKEQEVPG
jgi:hypothetical protein